MPRRAILLAAAVLAGIGAYLVILLVTPQPSADRPDAAVSASASSSSPAAPPPFHAPPPFAAAMDVVAADRQAIFALARGGSVAEIDMLVDQLQRETEPQRRITLRTALASITNHAAASHLIARLTTATDAEAIQALQRSLSAMADDALTRQLAADYETVPEAAAPHLTKVVEGILQDSAIPALAAIVADGNIPTSDPLTAAALRALARLGTPFAAASLARRLDSAQSPEDISTLSNLLSAVDRTGSENELAAIARGQQDTTHTHTRLAALRALRNYPGQTTRSIIASLALDPDSEISAQAQKMLLDMPAR